MAHTVSNSGPRRELYRVVVSYRYANGPLNIPSQPMTKVLAMALFARHVRSGSFTPWRNGRVRVLSVAECERWGFR